MSETKRVSFAKLVKEILRQKLGDSEFSRGEWSGKSNYVWARFPYGEDFYAYYVLQRSYSLRLTGELGFSWGKYHAAALPSHFAFPLQPRKDAQGHVLSPHGYRMRIGHVMGKGDVWWPCSQDPTVLRGEIVKMVDLLMRHTDAFFSECRRQIMQDLRIV